MAYRRQTISQMPPKGANLQATDLLEISEVSGTGYITKYITGQEIINSASGGSQDLQQVTDIGATTTNPIQITHNGSTDTLTATHSSGAGIGLLITKGGNNEGLKVNKTSGSGNAATIIGTLEATTLVKTGGTATEFLMADGTISTFMNPRVQSVASNATVTPTSTNDLVKITAQAAGLTLANPTGTFAEGQALIIRIKDDGTARSITYGSDYRAIGVTLPTTTVVSKTTYLGIIFNDTDTKWDVVGVTTQA